VNDQKQRAEALCRAINARLGWRGADPEFDQRELRYTGRVVLSRRAATEAARMLVMTGSSSRRG
jgi:hypothetical protein